MLIKKPDDIKSSEITSESVYLNRRNFIRAATLAGTAGASGLLYRRLNPASQKAAAPNAPPNGLNAAVEQVASGYRTAEGEAANSFEDITSYNNFYEFDTSKSGVASASEGFITRPWTVKIEGLVNQPREFDLDDLLKIASLEDRVYRFRCVEAWSMVIPWLGLPLAKLLAAVEPMSNAKYVKFVTLYDKKQMPNLRTDILDWPYQEGLRMDEAMHPLTLLASGLYGKSLPPQNGAPLRLVVPWKYGFKSIKSIVQIVLMEEQPRTTWNMANDEEYGFYSNVNPQVNHPRWSQATERRIGQCTWGNCVETKMFNGYADQVASMYAGMDLNKNF
ncbi:MAG: protein-methionine-sulfoxide reductase catalytic subunit MsrP [Acidobacteria bacterium]|nr:protein-methionine-sulfoxide reductase catalytic subunit MsrP [Acidobacteriota bacterium]